MKKLITAIFAGALLATSPAWAHGGDGHGHGKHSEKEWKKAHKHWAKKHRKMHRGHDHVVVHQHVHPTPAVVHHRSYVVRERVVLAPPAPPPGVHVVMPSLYIPF